MNDQNASIEAKSNNVQEQVEDAREMNTEKALQYIEEHLPEFDDDFDEDDGCEGVWICKDCWEAMQAEHAEQAGSAEPVRQKVPSLAARFKKKIVDLF